MTVEMNGYEISRVTNSRELKCRDVGKSGIVVKNYSVNWAAPFLPATRH